MCRALQVIYSNMARKPPTRPKAVGAVKWPAAPFLVEVGEELEPVLVPSAPVPL